MTPIAAIAARPLPMPGLAAAPATLDFAAFLDAGLPMAALLAGVDDSGGEPGAPSDATASAPEAPASDNGPALVLPELLAMLMPAHRNTAPAATQASPSAHAAADAVSFPQGAPPPAMPAADPAPADTVASTPPVELASVDAAPAAPEAPEVQPIATVAPQPRVTADDGGQTTVDTTDPRWIARMADEITRLAGDDGRARFRLNPETLGSMEITVRHGADGVSVRFEVENETTRALIAHVEHRLQSEARANGLRIADTQVDLAGQQQGRDGRDRPAEQPLIAIRAGAGDVPATIQSADGDDASARYA